MINSEDLLNRKTTKIVIGILAFVIVVALLFNYGLDFYSKVRCNSKTMILWMNKYCEDNGLKLKDMRFQDGLCITICGKNGG